RVAEKGFIVIDYPSEIYEISDTHECIDGNQLLYLIINIDTRQKPDSTNLKLPSLNSEKITRQDL
ncbi:442_t:CDS:1, partial [Racocetra persica]